MDVQAHAHGARLLPRAALAVLDATAPAVGALTTYGPHLKAPIGRIHWAGTETSDYWNGYMDGAVRSGERTAKEVGDQL